MMFEEKVPSNGTKSDYLKNVIAALGCYDELRFRLGGRMLRIPAHQGMLTGEFQHMGRGEKGHRYKLTAISNVVTGSKEN